MENKLDKLCPICIENKAEYYTECGHCYCIGCLSRIEKCALCRKSLIHTKLCIEIRTNKKNITIDTTQFVEKDDERTINTSRIWFNVF